MFLYFFFLSLFKEKKYKKNKFLIKKNKEKLLALYYADYLLVCDYWFVHLFLNTLLIAIQKKKRKSIKNENERKINIHAFHSEFYEYTIHDSAFVFIDFNLIFIYFLFAMAWHDDVTFSVF